MGWSWLLYPEMETPSSCTLAFVLKNKAMDNGRICLLTCSQLFSTCCSFLMFALIAIVFYYVMVVGHHVLFRYDAFYWSRLLRRVVRKQWMAFVKSVSHWSFWFLDVWMVSLFLSYSLWKVLCRCSTWNRMPARWSSFWNCVEVGGVCSSKLYFKLFFRLHF